MADELSPEAKAAAEAEAAKATTEAAAAEAAKKAAEEAAKTKQDMVPHAALHAEREARKTAEAELKKFQDERAASEKKALEEGGKFKELYDASEAKAKKLQEDLAAATGTLTAFEEATKTKIDTQINTIKSEEDKKTVQAILEGKTLSAQELLLPTLLKKFGVPGDINAGGGGTESATQATDRVSKEAEAIKKGDVMGALKNAPVITKK